MTAETARSIVKAINRRVKRARIFEGGRAFGVDYTTWSACYPQMARAFNEAATTLTGKNGRYLPAFGR